jgi:Transcriptional regulatory protein, C terminal
MLALAMPAPPADAAAFLVPANQVITASPAVGLTTPADGRLRGEDFTATVTGVAWPGSVRSDGADRVAGPGRRLVVFTLRVSQPTNDVGPLTEGTAATAVVAIGGNQVPVDLTALDEQIEGAHITAATGTGTESFCLSVPVDQHHVDLVLSESGFSQSFDLWTLQRLAPAPAVLYRDPRLSSLTVTSPGVENDPIENPADGFESPADVSLTSATLTYFAPDGSGTTPGDPATAYLVADLVATRGGGSTFHTPEWGHFFSTLTPLPGNRVTFTPTGGSPIEAESVPKESEFNNPAGDDGLVNAEYWFTVPATTTSGNIALTPGLVTGVEYTGFQGAGAVPLTLTGTGTLAVDFPAPPAAATQKTPSWVGKPVPAATTTASGNVASAVGSGGTSGGGFPIWLAVVLVVAVAAVAVVGERLFRQRRLAGAAAGPVTAAPNAPPPVVRPSSPTAPSATVPGPAAGPPPTLVPAKPPPLGGPDDLVVRVLGHVEVTGWDPPTERRAGLEALCCYLALHTERPVGSDQLLAALWPTDDEGGETTRKTLRNNLSRLRQAVGADHLPDAVAVGGYRLDGVVTDWGEFQRLAAEAATAGSPDANARLAEALAHVRGVPFEGVASAQYGWALDGPVHEMTAAVIECAHALAASRLAGGDPAGATSAARAGLRVSRTELTLWRDLFAAAGRLEDPGAVRRLQAEARRVLDRELADRLAGEAASD